MNEIAMKATVTGKVQGVGYRAWVKNEAKDKDPRGWVRNEDDGSVTVMMAGPPAAVEALASELKAGNDAAKIEDVTTEAVDMPDSKDFSIRG